MGIQLVGSGKIALGGCPGGLFSPVDGTIHFQSTPRCLSSSPSAAVSTLRRDKTIFLCLFGICHSALSPADPCPLPLLVLWPPIPIHMDCRASPKP